MLDLLANLVFEYGIEKGIDWLLGDDDDDDDQIPEYILAEEKSKMEAAFRSEGHSKCWLSVLFCAITLGCGYYCYAKEFISINQQSDSWFWWLKETAITNWLWLLVCIIGIITLITAIRYFITYRNYIAAANELNRMSIYTFRDTVLQ